MAHTRLIALNGNGGAYTPVYATQVTRRVEILEDGSANAGTGQGITYQFDDGSTTPFVTAYTIEPQTQPLILGTAIAEHAGYGLVIGKPAESSGGYNMPATLLANLKSATATATVVRVTEFD
jgi:hypothetical protein